MKILFVFLFIISLWSCHSSAIFERYEEIPEESWSRYNVVSFNTQVPDSGWYDIKICLRHTTDYEMANLWCFLRVCSPDSTQLSDTVNLKIAEPDGRWLGEGGTIKTLQHPINRNPVFLPKGDLVIQIEQGMRFEEVKGIKSVGVRVGEKVESRK